MMDNCTNAMAPSADELLRLVLDQEPLQEEAKSHLEHCSICQQQLAFYTRTQHQVLSKLYRSQCPTVTRLDAYCAGTLSGDEEIGIAYHIADCPLCTGEIVTMRQFLADFEPFPTSEKVTPSQRIIERIIATLVPWKPQLITRGPVSEGSWPRQYRAEKTNISLHLSRGSHGEAILLGLFTSDDPDEALEEQEGVPVELYRAITFSANGEVHLQGERAIEPPVMSAKIDDLGNVVFKAVPTGEYVMVVHLPECEVVIENLAIESS